MTTISDVFAFAAENADYWVEFLSGDEYPTELTEEETRALTAARKHIDELVVELLHGVGAKLAATLGKARLEKRRFKPASTAKNRTIRLPPPSDLDAKLYRIEFSLDRNEAGSAVALYASLVVKKAALDSLRQSLGERNVEHAVDGYHVYAAGLPITAGDTVDALAERSAQQAVRLLSGFEP